MKHSGLISYIYSINTVIKKDILQWIRNIELLVSGFIGPVLMYVLLNYVVSNSQGKGFNLFNSNNVAGLIYLAVIYTSLFWVGEPLYRERMYNMYLELMTVPIHKSYIILGKLLSGFIKTLLIAFLLYVVLSQRVGANALNINSAYFVLLLILNTCSLSILLSGLISSFPVYATIAGFSGIVCVIFAGALFEFTSENYISTVAAIIPTTHAYYAFSASYIGTDINILSIAIAHLFPIVSILLGAVLHSRKILKIGF